MKYHLFSIRFIKYLGKETKNVLFQQKLFFYERSSLIGRLSTMTFFLHWRDRGGGRGVHNADSLSHLVESERLEDNNKKPKIREISHLFRV